MVLVDRQSTVVVAFVIHDHRGISSILIAGAVHRVRRAEVAVRVPDAICRILTARRTKFVEHGISCVLRATETPEIRLVVNSTEEH